MCIVDSVPVPVVGFHHAHGAYRWHGETEYGRVAAKKQTVYGFKLHLLITNSGLILDFALATANHADGTLTEQLLIDKARLTVLWGTRTTATGRCKTGSRPVTRWCSSPPGARTSAGDQPLPPDHRDGQ